MAEQIEVVLARLDVRTKYIKEKLDGHIDAQCENCKLSDSVSILQTNVMWIKRLAVGIPGTLLTCLGIWKGIR